MKKGIATLALAASMLSLDALGRHYEPCYDDWLYVCHSPDTGTYTCLWGTIPWVTTTGFVNRATGGAKVGFDDIGYNDTFCDWNIVFTDCFGFPHNDHIGHDPIEASYSTGNLCTTE
jgi:hypothetical protein